MANQDKAQAEDQRKTIVTVDDEDDYGSALQKLALEASKKRPLPVVGCSTQPMNTPQASTSKQSDFNFLTPGIPKENKRQKRPFNTEKPKASSKKDAEAQTFTDFGDMLRFYSFLNEHRIPMKHVINIVCDNVEHLISLLHRENQANRVDVPKTPTRKVNPAAMKCVLLCSSINKGKMIRNIIQTYMLRSADQGCQTEEPLHSNEDGGIHWEKVRAGISKYVRESVDAGAQWTVPGMKVEDLVARIDQKLRIGTPAAPVERTEQPIAWISGAVNNNPAMRADQPTTSQAHNEPAVHNQYVYRRPEGENHANVNMRKKIHILEHRRIHPIMMPQQHPWPIPPQHQMPQHWMPQHRMPQHRMPQQRMPHTSALPMPRPPIVNPINGMNNYNGMPNVNCFDPVIGMNYPNPMNYDTRYTSGVPNNYYQGYTNVPKTYPRR